MSFVLSWIKLYYITNVRRERNGLIAWPTQRRGYIWMINSVIKGDIYQIELRGFVRSVHPSVHRGHWQRSAFNETQKPCPQTVPVSLQIPYQVHFKYITFTYLRSKHWRWKGQTFSIYQPRGLEDTRSTIFFHKCFNYCISKLTSAKWSQIMGRKVLGRRWPWDILIYNIEFV